MREGGDHQGFLKEGTKAESKICQPNQGEGAANLSFQHDVSPSFHPLMGKCHKTGVTPAFRPFKGQCLKTDYSPAFLLLMGQCLKTQASPDFHTLCWDSIGRLMYIKPFTH